MNSPKKESTPSRATQKKRRSPAAKARAAKSTAEEKYADLKEPLLAIQKIAKRYSQLDGVTPLRDQLQHLINESGKGEFTLAVVGAFTRGKSTFINALLRAEVVPTNVLPTTAVYTRISFGEEPAAELLFTRRKPRLVSLKEAKQYVATDTERIKRLKAIHIRYPSSYLEGGTNILDAPGIGSVYSEHREIALRCVAEADALVFVLASEPLLGEGECDFVREAQSQVGRIFFVQTKIDLYDNWPDRLEFNLSALEERTGVSAPKIYPISSHKMQAFQRDGRKADHKASRFHPFEQELTSCLGRDRTQVLVQKRQSMLRTAIERLRQQLELAVQATQESAGQTKQKLARRQKELDRLVAKNKAAFERSMAALRLFQRKAQQAVQAAGSDMRAAYNNYVSGAPAQDLEANAETRLLGMLRVITERLQKDLDRRLREATQEARNVLKTHLSAPRGPRLSGQIALRMPSTVTLNAGMVKTGGSSDHGGLGIVVGGAIGTVLFPVVGTAIGAGVGAAIGRSIKKDPKVDVPATRKEFNTKGRRIINRRIGNLRQQLDRQLAGWLEESEASIRRYIDRTNGQAQRQLAQRIAELEQEAFQATKRIKRLRKDLRHLEAIEQGLGQN